MGIPYNRTMKKEVFTDSRSLLTALAAAFELVEPRQKHLWQRTLYLSLCLAEELGFDDRTRRLTIQCAVLRGVTELTAGAHYTLRDARLNAAGIVGAAKAFLSLMPKSELTPQLLELAVPSRSKLPDRPGPLRQRTLINQLLGLSSRAAERLSEDAPALHQAAALIERVSDSDEKEYAPELVSALERLGEKTYVWMDLIYRPELFTELFPENRELTLDETVRCAEAFSLVIDFRSPFTAMHSAGVAAAAVGLARLMGMSSDEQMQMRIAANLHDLGKLKIPAEIIEKNGKLTEEEYAIVKEHSYYTYMLLKDIRGFGDIARWAGFHHEKPSGGGYPFGLADGDIPMGAKLMGAADVFSALTEDRPYRGAMEKERVIAILRENADSGSLSPRAVALLIENFDEINAARDKASHAAGARYYDAIGG